MDKLLDVKQSIDQFKCSIAEGTKLELRHQSNSPFLKGEETELKVKGSSKKWLYAGQAIKGLFGLAFLFLILAFTYIWAWDSGLVNEVITDRLELVQSDGKSALKYSYTVDGNSYERTESPGSRFSSGWSKADASEEIVYFESNPNWAKLEYKVERFEPFMSIISLIFVGCLAWSGHLMIAGQKRFKRLAEESTHVLLGTVVQVVPSQGFRYVIYEFCHPSTSETLRGTEQVGEAEKIKQSLVPGASVAVLYADPKTTILL